MLIMSSNPCYTTLSHNSPVSNFLYSILNPPLGQRRGAYIAKLLMASFDSLLFHNARGVSNEQGGLSSIEDV